LDEIQKNAKHNFLKEAKVAAFQVRCPPAVEAKAMNLKKLIKEKNTFIN